MNHPKLVGLFIGLTTEVQVYVDSLVYCQVLWGSI